MAYFRTKQNGDVATAVSSGSTGAAGTSLIPNYGITQISATSAEVYVLAPPIAGVEKTLIFHTYSTTALPIVKLSSDSAASPVSLLGSSTNLTVIKSAATKSTVSATVVQLKGLNSTSWIMMNVWPTMAGVTTGSTIVASGITVSST